MLLANASFEFLPKYWGCLPEAYVNAPHLESYYLQIIRKSILLQFCMNGMDKNLAAQNAFP